MSKIAKITEVDGTSSQDNNLTDIQKRTQNMLDNAKEQIKKAKDKVKNTRPSELAEVDYTNYEDFSSDEFRNKPFMPAPIVNSAGYGTFRGEPIRVENALNSSDNPNEEVPKWANVKEEVPKMENHLEGWANRKEEVPEAAKESQYRNNFEMPGKPMNSTSPGGLNNKDARDTVGKAAEAAKDKGIIQLGLVAVVIAGTLGAYVWRNN